MQTAFVIVSITVMVTMVVTAAGLFLFFKFSKFHLIEDDHFRKKENDLELKVHRKVNKIHYDRINALHRKVNKLEIDIKVRDREIYRRSEVERKLRQEVAESIQMVKRDAKHTDFIPRFQTPLKMWTYLDGYLDMILNNVRKIV